MPPTWSLHDHTAGAVLGSFGSRARAHTAAAQVEAGHTWTLWEWGDALVVVGEVVDQGTGPLLDPFPSINARYRIECVERPESAALHRRHITAISTVEPGGAKRLWDDISIVREAIADGDFFFTQDPAAERLTPVERHDCSCGRATIRSSLDHPAGSSLDNVKSCAFRE